MNPIAPPAPDPCVVAGVAPLLNELRQPVRLRLHGPDDPQRSQVEQFVQQVFLRSYGARLSRFYPTLLSFASQRQVRGAVGFRHGLQGPLFAEQYLPAPAQSLIAARWQEPVGRERLVEVGNLALAHPGEARWLIAAVTLFLHACGYRWVLFTAVRPLFNAFQRLGLNPVALSAADPACLTDGGRDWGCYYDQRPVTCVGDIRSGFRKLNHCVGDQQPLLHSLLQQALGQALRFKCDHDLLDRQLR